MIPNCPGAVFDLWQNDSMSKILDHFMAENSMLQSHTYYTHVHAIIVESICAVGYGVCALFSAMHGSEWCFKNYCLTSVSTHYYSQVHCVIKGRPILAIFRGSCSSRGFLLVTGGTS